MILKLGLFVVLVSCVAFCKGDDAKTDLKAIEGVIEQGRTLVHHAAKRFMIILPAIFFKLGIAFTLLILITIVAVNNGFIGFLLLVVGLSSVLARLQEARRSTFGAYAAPLPQYYHLLDRKDEIMEKKSEDNNRPLPISNYQYFVSTRPSTSYSGFNKMYYDSQ